MLGFDRYARALFENLIATADGRDLQPKTREEMQKLKEEMIVDLIGALIEHLDGKGYDKNAIIRKLNESTRRWR